MTDEAGAAPLDTLMALRQHQHDGKRSPDKPLLVLMALGELAASGSSAMRWSAIEARLATLISDFGPPPSTAAAQSAAYPFTRPRSDGVWTLSQDVRMDRVGPLSPGDVAGRLDPRLEARLAAPGVLHRTARALADAFPSTMAGDVLAAVGLDRDFATASPENSRRTRNAGWPARVLVAWDRQCAFCGFNGQLGGGSVAP